MKVLKLSYQDSSRRQFATQWPSGRFVMNSKNVH